MTPLTYPALPETCLLVLIGASGAGKSTLAATWTASQVLNLDAMREAVSDDAGDQDATGDAVAALHLILEARMARRRFTVVDATNVTASARLPLIAAAKRHNMPVIAVIVDAPASLCISRQARRPANRAVPEPVVIAQYKEMLRSYPHLAAEGFNQVVHADGLYRLLPYVERLGQARTADLGLDGGPGLGDLVLVRRTFGPEILPLWQWKDGSDIAGGDRVAQIRLGQQYLTVALRTNVDGEGDVGFDVAVPCPFDVECAAHAWVPAYSVTCLFRALNGDLDTSEDIVCTVHGGFDDVDQEADDHAAAALEATAGNLR
jgi:predicted kinase